VLRARGAFLEVRDLSKAYGWRYALRGVSFDLAEGEAVSLVGANGAGKTTLLRVLAGLARPSGGAVLLNGRDRWSSKTDPAAVRRRVGYVAHDTMLYEDLSAAANLHLYARLYDLPDGESRAADLLDRPGLAEQRRERVRAYSHGMRQRLALARALLHRPSLLLLDEPAAGLDADGASLLGALIAERVGEGCAVLLATHDLDRALAASRRVLVLAGGRLVADVPCHGMAPERLATPCHAVRGAVAAGGHP
jgi:heme ABC exporter ATP-binding subunit CcmA